MANNKTAAIASSLTINQMESDIRGPQDLSRLQVASVPKSTSMRYLKGRFIHAKPYKNVYAGMQAVAQKKVDVMVYDAPVLQYIANTKLRGQVEVLPFTFQRQDYGIALPTGSPLRKPINRLMLRMVYEKRWKMLLARYLGE